MTSIKGDDNFYSLKDLKDAIFAAWENVSQYYLDILVQSMKNRICEGAINVDMQLKSILLQHFEMLQQRIFAYE